MESTGDIVFVGIEEEDEEDDLPALHIYNFKDEWHKVGEKSVPCDHDHWDIIPVMIKNKERLLVSCYECQIIWFCDTARGKFSVALKKKGLYPGAMCKAEGDHVYIVNQKERIDEVLKAKCTSTGLIVDKIKTIHPKMEGIVFMAYLPDNKCIVLSCWKDNLVKAFHCGTGEQVWEVRLMSVEYVDWEPYGLLYLPEHKSLLVCDKSDDGLLVVNPSDGSILQTISLPDVPMPTSLSMHEGNIVLYHDLNGSAKISVVAIR